MSIFQRVEAAYDLRRMDASRVVLVGCGGAAGFAEDLMRAGLGEILLIDPDTVGDANLATQSFYSDEVGELKVDALARRLRRIRPYNASDAACIVALPGRAQDLSQLEWTVALGRPLLGRAAPEAVLLVGATDDFATQAYLNRVSLALNVPSLCAQVWPEGRGAEVSLWAPGADLPCHRCLLAARYAAMAAGHPEGSSRGTIYFAAPRLNALMGQLAVMMLHQGTGHPRWASLAEAVGRRTLAQIRLDPCLAETLGIATFERAFAGAATGALVFDETIWLAKPADPHCPDCAAVKAGVNELSGARCCETLAP